MYKVLLAMQAVLLFVNGLAVLNNERFLEPCKSALPAASACCVKAHFVSLCSCTRYRKLTLGILQMVGALTTWQEEGIA